MYLQDAHSIREGMELTQYAESKGFDSVWQADSRLVRDCMIPMAAWAATTEQHQDRFRCRRLLEPQPGPPRREFLHARRPRPRPGDPRHRRLVGSALAAKVGIKRDRPLLVMREIVESVRALLACDGPVTYDGYHVHLDGVELDYVHQERRAKNVPIYIGATGMQMMELTGQIADGAVLNYLVSPKYNLQAMDALEKGAKKAGRSATDLDRPQLVVCSMSPTNDPQDRKHALDNARLLVTQYLGQQPHIMKASGVPGVVARGDRQGPHVAGDARPGGRSVEAGSRRHRADDHRIGYSRRVPRAGRQLHQERRDRPDPVPAGRRRPRHDRRLLRLDRLADLADYGSGRPLRFDRTPIRRPEGHYLGSRTPIARRQPSRCRPSGSGRPLRFDRTPIRRPEGHHLGSRTPIARRQPSRCRPNGGASRFASTELQ